MLADGARISLTFTSSFATVGPPPTPIGGGGNHALPAIGEWPSEGRLGADECVAATGWAWGR